MITKEEFIELINEHVEHCKTLTKLSDILDDDNIFENKVVKYGIMLFEHILDKYFNDDGKELIYDWLYDNAGNKVVYGKDGKDTVLKTSEDLWNFVVETHGVRIVF